MNTAKYMIILKGEIKTSKVKSCNYNKYTKKMDVEFIGGKIYSYTYSNVELLKEPTYMNPELYRVFYNGNELLGISAIYLFKGEFDSYFHIFFKNGSERDYLRKDLKIKESCLSEKNASTVFEYIKQIAELNNLINDFNGEKLLKNKFEDITFISKDTVLAEYLNPEQFAVKNGVKHYDYTPIFPFSCNNSQYSAVKQAMENKISVIQGPPGTGKTQTILNIIANILMQGKSVQIVSNNNSATENIYEKLSSDKYNLGFIAAQLGNADRKKAFIENQSAEYPNLKSWRLAENSEVLKKKILNKSLELKKLFDAKEYLADLKQERSQLLTEYEYFKKHILELNIDISELNFNRKLNSKQILKLWNKFQEIIDDDKSIGLAFKIKNLFLYGIKDFEFYKKDLDIIIKTLQNLYYVEKKIEIDNEIEEKEILLNDVNSSLIDEFCNDSMSILKDILARKYENNKTRKIFEIKDIWKNSKELLKEYPVILSTTFSSRSSLNSEIVYDYVIIDESSQVDIPTGVLAMSCAENIVIVGDTKQLPHVVTGDIKKKAESIFDSFNIDDGYKFTKSFLQSVLEIIPDVPQTMLREHYRCHPKIINFCNQKFYRGELIIMTEDKNEEDVLTVFKTVKGNHSRNHYSQRQIDIVKNEIIPKYVTDKNDIGIITPYRNQVKSFRREFSDIEAATVHKFQGREKDTIIISTVDDEISDFADDPYLINVAVSRAKKRLILVVSGNEQNNEGNISDLINYIEYNNFEIIDSKIYSIFDYLYKQYDKEREKYLKEKKLISEYDSENLMYALIMDILSEDKYKSLDVVCHFPMNMLIKDYYLLNKEEFSFVRNSATHIDFLIYSRISKKPVLAIEVDGYAFHKSGTAQAYRDALKNHILELYQIPYLRFSTNGSEERNKLSEILNLLII